MSLTDRKTWSSMAILRPDIVPDSDPNTLGAAFSALEHLRCDDVLRPRSDQGRAHGFRRFEPGVVPRFRREESGVRRDDQPPLAPRLAGAVGAQQFRGGFDRRPP